MGNVGRTTVRNKGDPDPRKRIHLDQSAIYNKRLSNLVTRNTRKFFEIVSIPDAFLEVDPETWKTNPDFLQAENVVWKLRVVNDITERGVALMPEYNMLLTEGNNIPGPSIDLGFR